MAVKPVSRVSALHGMCSLWNHDPADGGGSSSTAGATSVFMALPANVNAACGDPVYAHKLAILRFKQIRLEELSAFFALEL